MFIVNDRLSDLKLRRVRFALILKRILPAEVTLVKIRGKSELTTP